MGAKYSVKVDQAKNRLYLILEGFFSEAEAKSAADEVIVQARKMKPGFSVVNDISKAQPFSEEGTAHIQRAQSFLQQQGVGRVIRVVEARNILSRMQFERKGKEAGYTASQEVAATLEEADRMLDAKA
ncbi:MAG: hypothetical protein AB1439_07365 [candidate division FCPU426 bacterium]